MIGRAICETLTDQPNVCSNFDQKTVIIEEQKTSVFMSLMAYFYVIIIGLLVLALLCVCVARKAARREVNEEVKRSVANYFSMKEVESLQ